MRRLAYLLMIACDNPAKFYFVLVGAEGGNQITRNTIVLVAANGKETKFNRLEIIDLTTGQGSTQPTGKYNGIALSIDPATSTKYIVKNDQDLIGTLLLDGA